MSQCISNSCSNNIHQHRNTIIRINATNSIRLKLVHPDALRGAQYSAVAEHAVQTDHNIDWNNVKILASDSKEINLFYSKSLLILKQNQV